MKGKLLEGSNKSNQEANLLAAVGKKFMTWAESYLYDKSDMLNVYFHFHKAYAMYVLENSFLMSSQNFKDKLIIYCKSKGWLYNPKSVEYLNEDGRIFIQIDIRPEFDQEDMCWILKPLDKKEIAEFFFIQSECLDVVLSKTGLADYLKNEQTEIKKPLYPAGYLDGFSMEQLKAMLRNLKENIANTVVDTSEYRQMVKQLVEIEAHASCRFDGLVLAERALRVNKTALNGLVEESGFREENLFKRPYFWVSLCLFWLMGFGGFCQMPKFSFETDTIEYRVFTRVVSVDRLPKHGYEFSYCVRQIVQNVSCGYFEDNIDFLQRFKYSECEKNKSNYADIFDCLLEFTNNYLEKLRVNKRTHGD